MSIVPTGRAVIVSKDDGQRYVIEVKELEWNQVGGDERSMGPELQYLGEVHHSELGDLTWSVWEYPIGMLNHQEQDINGHALKEDFHFIPEAEPEHIWEASPENIVEPNLPEDQLKVLSSEDQQDYIISWFRYLFWDPAEETPYNGREGGYLYVHGGPYDARSELADKFYGVVSDEVIDAATDEIESDGTHEWAPSPAHPDQLQAAEDYYESLGPQSLEEIDTALKGGAKTSLDSPAAKSAATELKQTSEALIAMIDNRQPEHGGLGHNGPALDDEGNPLPDGFENEMRETAVALSEQMESDVPDVEAVVEATARLQGLRTWLAPKLDLAADEFIKGFAKTAGVAAAGFIGTLILSTFVPGLDAAIGAALVWLRTILV